MSILRNIFGNQKFHKKIEDSINGKTGIMDDELWDTFLENAQKMFARRAECLREEKRKESLALETVLGEWQTLEDLVNLAK